MRKMIKTAGCAFAVLMLLGITACGGNKQADVKEAGNGTGTAAETVDTEDVNEKEEISADGTEAAESGASESGKYMTVAEFAASKTIQDEIAGMQASLAESGVSISVVGEENKLIYTYTYLELTESAGMSENLKELTEEQAETFTSLANMLKLATEEEDPVVVIRYLDSAGREIYMEEFAAQ